MIRRRSFSLRDCICAATFFILAAAPVSEAAAWTIGLGGQVYRDDANLETEKRIGPQSPVEEDTDYESDDIGSFGIYALFPMQERVFAGGGLRYYGTYDTLEPLTREERQQLEEDGEEDTREPYEFGTALDAYAHLQWELPIITKLDLLLGTQVGLNILFPSGNFEETINSEKDDGASLFGGPRLGLLFGPQVGVRYGIIENRLAVRADLGARYNRMILFRNEEEIDGVAYRLDWTMNILRYDAGLAVELSF